MANPTKTRVVSLALLAATLLISMNAFAQDSPDWNRRVLSFELSPPSSDEPAWTSRTELSVMGFTPIPDGVDGSLVLQHLVNGEVVNEELFQLAIGTPGNCDCTSGCDYLDGWCDNSEFGCWCGVVVRPAAYVYKTRNLNPGDVVGVRIVAAPGSVDEQHTDDDLVTVVVEDSVPAAKESWSSVKSLYR